MRILVLDDDESRHETFRKNLAGNDVVHVYSFHEACQVVTDSERFDVFYLDHDLMDFHDNSGYCQAPLEFTGYHFVHWTVNDMPVALRPELVVVHSWNPSGAMLMFEALRDAGFKAYREEFWIDIGMNLILGD